MVEMPPIPDEAKLVLASVLRGPEIIAGYEQYMGGEYIGSNTAMIAEASDASASGATVEDGMSGYVKFLRLVVHI
jgi:hypothetical protein